MTTGPGAPEDEAAGGPDAADTWALFAALSPVLDELVDLQPEIERIVRACATTEPESAGLARSVHACALRLAHLADVVQALPATTIVAEVDALLQYHEHLVDEMSLLALAPLPRTGRARSPGDTGPPAARLRGLRERVASLLAGDDDAIPDLPDLGGDAASHGLRKPLTAVLAGASSPGQGDLGLSGRDAERALEAIVAGSLRLRRSVDNLMVLAALRAGVLVPELDWHPLAPIVRAAVAEACGDAAAGARRPVVFACALAGSEVVWTEHGLLRRALVNLIDNALRHTPVSAAVNVSVGRGPGRFEVVIADEGAGLPAPLVAAVGSRSLPDGGAALGTGIAAAIELVRTAGGRIDVRAAGGTHWRVVLPAHDASD